MTSPNTAAGPSNPGGRPPPPPRRNRPTREQVLRGLEARGPEAPTRGPAPAHDQRDRRNRRATSERTQSRQAKVKRQPTAAPPGASTIAHLRPLDGLRGLAVLLVVLFHFSPSVAPGGFLGVDIFFVLSGFLITSLLVREREQTQRISLLGFWSRRARRLIPALLLVLAAVGVYTLFLADQVYARRIAEDGLSAFSYVANWHFIASSESYIQQFITKNGAPSPLRHMWSLAIEEQFYIVWPLIVLGVTRLFRKRASDDRTHQSNVARRNVLAVVCVVLAAASVARMIQLYQPGTDPSRVYYGTDTHASLLLLGAALGAVTAGRIALRSGPIRDLLVLAGCVSAGVLAWLLATADTNSSWLYEGGYAAVALGIVVLLAASAQPGLNPLRRLFESRALVALGLISYGVYLWHWPAFVWLTPGSTGIDGVALFGLRSGATLIASVLSFVLVEQPIRRGHLPKWTKNPGVIPAAVATAVAVVLLVPAIAFPEVASVSSAAPSTSVAVAARGYAAAPRCDGGSLGSASPEVLAGQRVELVGNSVAEELKPCLGVLIASRGATFHSITKNGTVLCVLEKEVKARVRDPATRPTIGVIFWIPGTTPLCGSKDGPTQVRRMVAIFTAVGAHVVLVPLIPAAATSEKAPQWKQYRALAATDPAHISVLDGGTFLRDVQGTYQWRMPCSAGSEPGCDPDDTVAVRNPVDGGDHFCADPGYAFDGRPCPANFAGGERRVSSAIAAGLFSPPASG